MDEAYYQYTVDEPTDKLLEALDLTNDIDWTERPSDIIINIMETYIGRPITYDIFKQCQYKLTETICSAHAGNDTLPAPDGDLGLDGNQ